MAHVPLLDEPKGVVPRIARRYTTRRFGRMVEPTAAASHHSGVLVAMGSLETAVQLGWKKLDPTLRWLAIQAVSSQIGCSWCIDFGYYEGMHEGIDPAKVRAVGDWRTSDLFDDRERGSWSTRRRPPGARPRSPRSSPSGYGRTSVMRSSSNSPPGSLWRTSGRASTPGLGLRSQGFSDSCGVAVGTSTEAVA